MSGGPNFNPDANPSTANFQAQAAADTANTDATIEFKNTMRANAERRIANEITNNYAETAALVAQKEIQKDLGTTLQNSAAV